MEVEKLRREYELEVRWWPYLLDASIPPEGREREPRTKPDDPPTQLELRGERVGITFRRGRRFTPNSHLALETAEYAQEIGHDGDGLHRALFAAHFEGEGDIDLTNQLRTVVPSFNVNTQPISDAATIVRPANLRNMAPDHTLILVNGKRRHRAAVIAWLGNGIADGAQGP